MTSEKRAEMLKLKQKAIQLEQKRIAGKKSQPQQIYDYLESVMRGGDEHQADLTAKNETKNDEPNIQQRYAEYQSMSDGMPAKRCTISYAEPLKRLPNCRRQKGGGNGSANEPNEVIIAGAPLAPQSSEIDLFNSRMQKLQKSETQIYDNYKSKQEMVAEDFNKFDTTQIISQTSLTDNEHTQIPNICVDPPTPVVANRSFGQSLSAIDSSESVESSPRQAKCLDDSSNSFSDSSAYSTLSGNALKSQQKTTNIASQVFQYEILHSSVPSTPCSGIQPPQRSATSPSLKKDILRASCSLLGVNCNTPQSPNTLVRSNSFTIDTPSQVLLEHLRKANKHNNSPSRCGGKRIANLPSPSTTRHTIESKAKRVQKSDLTKRNTPVPNNAAQRALATRGTALYASNSHSAAAQTSNRISKRSPYELKSTTPTKSKLSKPLKKSTIVSASQNGGMSIKATLKSKGSMPVLKSTENLNKTLTPPSTSREKQNSPQSTPRTAEIEATHRQKFLRLLALQQVEQRKLQKAFEAQQQVLLQQLSAELAKTHAHPPPSQEKYQEILNNLSVLSNCCTAPLPNSPSTMADANLPLIVSFAEHINGPSDMLDSYESTATLTPAKSVTARCLNTPRRRLFSRHNISPASSVGRGHSSSPSSVNRRVS